MRTPLLFTCLLSLPLVAGLPGCGSDGDPGVPVNTGVPLVDIEAEPKAGFEFMETTYTVPGTNEERTLRLNVWYATEDTEGELTRFNAISVDRNSFLNASVRVPRGQAPVMIYTHGDQGWGGSAYTLARQFVQNGWIVVAVDHTGNTVLDNTDPRPFEFDVVRAYDVNATLDLVAELPAEHPLAGHLDTSRVLVVGHSYGGQTAWMVGGAELDLTAIEARCAPTCVQAELDAYAMYEADPRVVAVVAMDGEIRDDSVADTGFTSMQAAVMALTPADMARHQDLFDRSAGADVTWVQLDGACHESFTSTNFGSCPTLALPLGRRITANYAIAFGIRHVLQSDDAEVLALLDGTTEVDPIVTVSHHAP
jgi:predicted dienelactone hydrolase